MSNEQMQPDPLAALRLEVEQLHETAERSRDMTFGFAQTAIRSMFILNGGALIAVPAFAKLAGADFQENLTAFIMGGLGFVAGLILIAFTTVLAYLAMDSDAKAIRQAQVVVKTDLNHSEDPERHTDEMKRRRSEATAAQQRFNCRSDKLRVSAIWSGVGSMVAFIFGTVSVAVAISAVFNN